MKRTLRIATIIGLLVLATQATAELRIEISQGVDKAIPIAVVPFGIPAPAPDVDVAAVIAADLAHSGRFAPIAVSDMLQTPTRGRDVDFGDWRIIGVDYVILGQVLPSGPDGYTIQFEVFDVFGGKQLLGYRQPARKNALLRTSHHVADMIYEELTGIPGVFATRIAYITVTGQPGQQVYRLIVADSDGRNRRVLLESPQPLMSPAWSPDGRKLAYVSFENDRSEIYIQTLRTGARQRVSARPGVNGAPAWSPDGRKLALSLSQRNGNLDIHVLELATQVLSRLTERRSIDTEPVWSADGKDILFTSDRSGAPQIYRIAADGSGTPRRVSFEGSYNARPRISPDGRLLAVVHNDRGNYRIATIDLKRGVLQVLTEGRLDESPSFAPNGEKLIYATRAGGRGVLATVSIDGRIRQRISTPEGDVREPVWSPFPLK